LRSRSVARTIARAFARGATKPAKSDYYRSDELGLAGRWDPRDRLAGIDHLDGEIEGRSVLDLGCAEGLVSKRFVDAGASVVHAVDRCPRRIDRARRLWAGRKIRFGQVDLNDPNALSARGWPEMTYDVIAMLGVYQHLDTDSRAQTLRWVLRHCRRLFVLRAGARVVAEAAEVLGTAGLDQHRRIPCGAMNDLLVYRRGQPMRSDAI
jgi:2-polyprenyl-3-methyl-5-hydroxy-6-metoxy-1,4-benzoquinol methylase